MQLIIHLQLIARFFLFFWMVKPWYFSKHISWPNKIILIQSELIKSILTLGPFGSLKLHWTQYTCKFNYLQLCLHVIGYRKAQNIHRSLRYFKCMNPDLCNRVTCTCEYPNRPLILMNAHKQSRPFLKLWNWSLLYGGYLKMNNVHGTGKKIQEK